MTDGRVNGAVQGRGDAQAWPTGACCEFRGVWFSYGGEEPAVQDVSFRAPQGEFVAVLGPNGSGKTTLLRLALGLLRPTRGTVTLFGVSAHEFRDWNRVGYVPQRVQSIGLHFPATVEEVVSHGLYGGFDPLAFFRRTSRPEALEALERVGIAHLRRRHIESLSVGQRQRALIARAIVKRPDVLFLDEPVAGVDAAGREQFHGMLRSLNAEYGMTVFMISHDIGAVMQEATMCACINRTMVFHGPPHQVTAERMAELYGFPVDVLMHDVFHEHR